MPSLTRMLGPIPLVQLPRKVRLELWDAPLSRHLGLSLIYQAVMRTQMSLLLRTSCRRHPWMITYLAQSEFFFSFRILGFENGAVF